MRTVCGCLTKVFYKKNLGAKNSAYFNWAELKNHRFGHITCCLPSEYTSCTCSWMRLAAHTDIDINQISPCTKSTWKTMQWDALTWPFLFIVLNKCYWPIFHKQFQSLIYFKMAVCVTWNWCICQLCVYMCST